MDAIGPRTDLKHCEHSPAGLAEPRSDTCEECGSDNRLRLCAACGHVGCCESQAGHARAHALREGHSVIFQIPAPDGIAWCYEEGRYL